MRNGPWLLICISRSGGGRQQNRPDQEQQQQKYKRLQQSGEEEEEGNSRGSQEFKVTLSGLSQKCFYLGRDSSN
jgi:hypothetical protein